MQQLATRPWIAAGVALAGLGVITVSPVTVMTPAVHVADIALTSGEEMVLDLVRHGQSTDNVAGILGTTPPGAALTDLGKEQAIAVGQALYNGGDNDIDGVYASEFLRTQQTAWPLDQLLLGHSDYGQIPSGPTPLLEPSQILYGLDEVDAGILNDAHLNILTELAYLAAPVQWILGDYFAPMLGATANPNGAAFEDRFTDAVQTIYHAGGATSGGDLHDVAFSHDGAITAWTLMNVKNPDFGLVLQGLIEKQELLPNTGQVVIEGNPTDGWTLVSWDGHDVPQTPDLLTGLFVDWRDLITAPQMALWNLWEAIQGGDQADISSAFQNGLGQISAAITQFPQAVIDTLTDSAGTAGQTAGSSVLDGLASVI